LNTEPPAQYRGFFLVLQECAVDRTADRLSPVAFLAGWWFGKPGGTPVSRFAGFLWTRASARRPFQIQRQQAAEDFFVGHFG